MNRARKIHAEILRCVKVPVVDLCQSECIQVSVQVQYCALLSALEPNQTFTTLDAPASGSHDQVLKPWQKKTAHRKCWHNIYSVLSECSYLTKN